MASESQDLKTKIGPLPAWAWGGIIVGGLLLFRYLRARNTATRQAAAVTATNADANADPTATTASVDPFAQAYQDYLTSDPTNPAVPISYGNVRGVPSPVTDTQWAKLVSDGLMGQGGDPTAITTAISKYLSGQSLTAAEDSIVNHALSLFGSPPEGIVAPVLGQTGIGATDTGGTVTPAPSVPLPVAPTPAPEPSTSIMQGTLSGYQYDAAGNQISGPYQGVPGANALGFLGSTTSIAPGQPGYVNPSTPQTQAPGWYETDARGQFLAGDQAAYSLWAANNPQYIH